ncbi:unnamed protein product [Rotaria sordida]|uniref:Uncharacterized protein n=1 Tax=Rotaria sordida TaxID=392033 RepID=A0A819ZXI9_9BILA|nr:unnamed protein product [Rotaria sordida]
MNILYSLIGIGNKRLENVAQNKIFTNTLSFVSDDFDNICSLNDSMVDRFCIEILPQIQDNVRCLIIESMNMERILVASNYPNLTELKIFNFNKEIVSRYFTGHLKLNVNLFNN